MEEWKVIEGYEGLYQVSNLGRVKSLPRVIIHKANERNNEYKHNVRERILKPRKHPCGYTTHMLYKNKKGKDFLTHRLVGITFIPNPENKPQINHISKIKTENHVENLEWCTNQENSNHRHYG